MSRLKYIISRSFHRPHIPIGAILMLHRVDSPNATGIWYNQHLKMSPKTIDEMVTYARTLKCQFVSLDEMVNAIRKKKNVRRYIAVTLDDGYRDNFVNGAPLFKKLNVPYTIYVCTKIVKEEMVYWWEILEKLVLEHNKVILNDGRVFNCYTKLQKEKAFLDIRNIILMLPQKELSSRIQELFTYYDINIHYGNGELGLTWEQLRELKNDSFATIGNHTYSHSAFTGCSDEAIYTDILNAAKEMRLETRIEMKHFAFPYGDTTAVSPHDIELVKKFGFTSSTTTKSGLVCYGTDPLQLPRLFVTERNWKQVIDNIVYSC